MVGLSLIVEAARRGLRVRADGDRLVIRGPKEQEEFALGILERKREVLDALRLHPDYEGLDYFSAGVLQVFDGTVCAVDGFEVRLDEDGGSPQPGTAAKGREEGQRGENEEEGE